MVMVQQELTEGAIKASGSDSLYVCLITYYKIAKANRNLIFRIKRTLIFMAKFLHSVTLCFVTVLDLACGYIHFYLRF